MLKEWVDALRPFVLALENGECARDLGSPIGPVGKTRPPGGRLFEAAGKLVFEEYFRLPDRHSKLRFLICILRPYLMGLRYIWFPMIPHLNARSNCSLVLCNYDKIRKM